MPGHSANILFAECGSLALDNIPGEAQRAGPMRRPSDAAYKTGLGFPTMRQLASLARPSSWQSPPPAPSSTRRPLLRPPLHAGHRCATLLSTSATAAACGARRPAWISARGGRRRVARPDPAQWGARRAIEGWIQSSTTAAGGTAVAGQLSLSGGLLFFFIFSKKSCQVLLLTLSKITCIYTEQGMCVVKARACMPRLLGWNLFVTVPFDYALINFGWREYKKIVLLT